MSFLDEYKRQPKLFVDIPSSGTFYDHTVFEDSQFVQIPIYAMTAADDIMAKTPDALFSGKAVASVLESCVPLLKDPWQLIKTDLEYLLTAIRIASTGSKTDMKATCNVCNTENAVEIDLQNVLAHYDNFNPAASFKFKDLTINLRPITFKQLSDLGIELYQKQRTLFQLQAADMDQDEKNKQAAAVANDVLTLTTRALTKYIISISKDDKAETDSNIISNFIEENDSEISKMFTTEITKFITLASYPELKIQCAGEINDERCTNTYSVEYNSDFSSFFVRN
jgi:hypothetical protein